MGNSDRKIIYLDNAATTRVDERVFKAMQPFFVEKYGNASSAHQLGKEARDAVEKAREQTADFLGCSSEEIIFTSCATESNNLAIKGVLRNIQYPLNCEAIAGSGASGSFTNNQFKKAHIITTNIEHHCVLNVCRGLEKDGLTEVTYLPVDKEGLISVKQVEDAIRENTAIISIMYANNEIGAIQPIEEISRLIMNVNKSRGLEIQQPRILFHTDVVQAANYLDCNVDKLGIDLLSISAHKIYGPKGVGMLYVRKGTPISRIQDGGEHEFKLRSGTLNVPGIVGLGDAISLISNDQVQMTSEIKSLRDKLIEGVLDKIPNSKLNGSKEKRLPNNANFSFPGAEGEAILLGLDLEGVAVSTGSACASENLNPSHVLMALGLGPEDAHSSIRMSLGKDNTKEEIDYVLRILPGIIERLRQISGSGSEQKKAKLPDDFGC